MTSLTVNANRTFSTTRVFADDHPQTGTLSDPFTVEITIADNEGASDTETYSAVLTIIDENGAKDTESTLLKFPFDLLVFGNTVEIDNIPPTGKFFNNASLPGALREVEVSITLGCSEYTKHSMLTLELSTDESPYLEPTHRPPLAPYVRLNKTISVEVR